METVERWLAWIIHRAARDGATMKQYEQYRDTIVGLAHYANGTALSRDFRAIRGWNQ